MAIAAASYTLAQALKLKLTGEPSDAERVRAVRAARPEVWLGVDANQSFTREVFDQLLPVLLDARVSLIEQPFPVGEESQLEGLKSPIPVAADESMQTFSDLPALAGLLSAVNIKLDKSGGLTGALIATRAARELGMEPMIGNMLGTSLAMAPASVAGQLCRLVDLDGPLFLRTDRVIPAEYLGGRIEYPASLWGHGISRGHPQTQGPSQ